MSFNVLISREVRAHGTMHDKHIVRERTIRSDSRLSVLLVEQAD
jgi:hypothetical protein